MNTRITTRTVVKRSAVSTSTSSTIENISHQRHPTERRHNLRKSRALEETSFGKRQKTCVFKKIKRYKNDTTGQLRRVKNSLAIKIAHDYNPRHDV
jgi:hypothetical protein